MKKKINLSGRVKKEPSIYLNEMLLKPQFEFEVKNLLKYYLEIELAIIEEQYRLKMINEKELIELRKVLTSITENSLISNLSTNFSDISFAIEEYVANNSSIDFKRWHLDKSRNDFQATALKMYGREQIEKSKTILVSLYNTILTQAKNNQDIILPGYTHNQPAQVISAGFYFVTIAEVLKEAVTRLDALLEEINTCPLGTGAMAGLEFDWDREFLSSKLNFRKPIHSALQSVAEKDWVVKIFFELAMIGNKVSRFTTDFIKWSSYENSFIDLPDEYVGISSAMPQKRNHTILERIRGNLNHLNSFLLDSITVSQSTSYTNTVEVNKEGTRYIVENFDTFNRAIFLFELYVSNMFFNKETCFRACTKDFLGGFSLANFVCINCNVTYREAQKIVGTFLSEVQNVTDDSYEKLNDILKSNQASNVLTKTDFATFLNPFELLEKKVSMGGTSRQSVSKMIKENEIFLNNLTSI
ncbi:argininosuccinate lyase [Enterococcus termitis]